MPLKLFVDFDGTITRHDVGNIFYRTFGGAACDELVRRFRAGEIGARACFTGESAAMGRVLRADLEELIDAQEIDPTFPNLVAFCGVRGIDLLVVSDGLDMYIRRILSAHGCPDVRFVANEASLVRPGPDGRAEVAVAFPHADAECDRCACCKRNIMLTSSSEEDVIAYVGEGFSDRCPVRFADIVFAKDVLQTYCQNENISYTPYVSFDDVVARLTGLLEGGRLRARPRAALERRAAFRHES
ncbi:MAG TPA: MtnX-like HAD-IB family phosphatase [Bacteroidota bacterium]|nr:MtnX-like HAD-IB family phosphatase [Bacteroidota bacterium]